MRTPFALRFVLTALAAFALVALVQGRTPVANAGEATASFDPDPLQILEGGAGNLLVSIEKDLTADEAADKEINVDLILPGGIFGDTVIDSKSLPVTVSDPQEGDTVSVAAKFVMRCTDDVIVGDVGSTGAASAELEVEFPDTFPDTAASGSGTVECAGEALVTFDPNPLEIEEGAEEKVSVTFTKHLTFAEANNKRITVRLMHQGTDTLLGTKIVKLAGQLRIGKKVTWTTSFQLQCKNDEIRGVNGTGLASAPLSVEFTEDGEDAGDGRALCIGRTSSTFSSGGSHPSDIFVDEASGFAFVLNAFDGAIGVFDGTTLINTINLPCAAARAGISGTPPGFACQYQVLAVKDRGLGGKDFYAIERETGLLVWAHFDDLLQPADFIQTITVGELPSGMARDALTGDLYVANSGDGTVSVIDPEAFLVVDTIDVGGTPRNVAADPDGGMVYVTDFAGDRVIMIDTDTNAVVDTIDVGDGAEGVTVDSLNGDVIVTNFLDDSLSVISGATGAAAAPGGGVSVQTVPVGDGPIDVDVNPLTNRIFVVNANDDTMTVIDRTTLEVVATLPTGITPDAVAVNQGAGLVYVANHDVNSVTVYSDTSHFDERRWGDMDCDDTVGPSDVLVILSTLGGVPSDGVPGCPGVGQPVDVLGFAEQDWGDPNCDNVMDGFDALWLILASAGVSVPDGGPTCPNVKELVGVY